VRKHSPLRSFDPMISETLVEVMAAEGPTLHTQAVPKAVVKNADGSLTLELDDGRSQTVDCLIWAIGREPANDTFNLDITGVKTDEKGFIVVDKFQNTSVPGIYAVGDNTGAVELTLSPWPQAVACLNACLITSRTSIWITAISRPWCSATRRSAPWV
jgi:glutathione reductase (NADPH)